MKPIFLWGYMGAGKSRLGKRLAQKIDAQYFDLDHLIEQKMNLVVPEIFNHFGEAYFRELERDLVREYAQKQDIILSCGGGTPCFHDNKTVMVQSGLVIYLDVEHQELVNRLWRNRTQRPLVAKMQNPEELSQFIAHHLAGRMPYYSHAHLQFNNTYPKGSLEELIQFIELNN